MKEPRRLSEMQAELNDELRHALQPNAVEPSELELQQWTSKLSSALGVALPPPAALSASTMSGAAKATAAASAAKTLPAWKLGAWVLSGVALGAGLSGAVTTALSAADNPAPMVSAVAQAATESAPAQPSLGASTLPLVPQPPLPQVSADPIPPPATPAQRAPRAGAAELTTEPTLPSADELSILHQAQASLRRNPAQALALSARHELEFPGGALAQEREVIAIDALLRLGRDAEAKARVRRFEARYPGSAHAQRVEQLLNDAQSR